MHRLLSLAWALLLAACGDADRLDPGGDCVVGCQADAGVGAADAADGPPDATPASLPCPPHACATATRDETGSCLYLSLADDVACDDGDACTADDRCVTGSCEGTAIAQDPSTHGAVMTYGAEPIDNWMEGVASFVSDDRVVFLESTKMSSSHLSLVRVDESGLARLSEAESRLQYQSVQQTIIYWSEEPATYVLPMGTGRFVVLASYVFGVNSGMEVFDFEDDALHSRGYTPLPGLDDPAALTLHGAAARDDALFVCGDVQLGGRLRAYALDAETSLFSLAADIAVPQGGCNDLALSPDGTRLYLAANGGYRVYDVTDPTQFVVPASGHVVLLPNHFVQEIEVGADHIVVTTAKVAGELDDAFVFDSEGTLIGPLAPPAGTNGTPFGIALSGSRLFVEWFAPGGAAPSDVLAVHDLAAAGAPVLAQRTFHQGGYPDTEIAPVARGDSVLLQPWRRVVRLGTGGLAEVTGPAHGSMRTLVPAGPQAVLALGPESWQRVDVTDPELPIVAAGGTSSSVSTDDNQLLVTAPGATPELISPRPRGFRGLLQDQMRERFTVVDASLTPPASVGRAYVDGPRSGAAFGFGNGQLYQVIPQGTSLHVRRFAGQSLIGLANQAWPVDLEQTIPGVDLPGFARARIMAVGVSPAGDEVLVATLRMTNEAISRFVFALSWLHVTPDEITVAAEGSFETSVIPFAIDVAFVDGAVIVLGNDRIARLSRAGAGLVVDLARDLPGGGLYQRILDADDRRVLVTRHDWIGPEGARQHVWSVDEIGVTDLVTSFSYDTPDEVQSIRASGTFLYFGMNAGLLVATPDCPL